MVGYVCWRCWCLQVGPNHVICQLPFQRVKYRFAASFLVSRFSCICISVRIGLRYISQSFSSISIVGTSRSIAFAAARNIYETILIIFHRQFIYYYVSLLLLLVIFAGAFLRSLFFHHNDNELSAKDWVSCRCMNECVACAQWRGCLFLLMDDLLFILWIWAFNWRQYMQ